MKIQSEYTHPVYGIDNHNLHVVSNRIQGKTSLDNLRLVVSTDPSNLSDSFLGKIADCYRDVFAHGAPVDPASWGEYARCPGCGKGMSFEQVTDLSHYRIVTEIEAIRHPPLPPCPHCGHQTELFYQHHDLMTEMQHHFRQRDLYAAFALDGNNQVRGFSYSWIDSIEAVWNEKISHSYQGSSLDWAEFSRQLEVNSQGRLRPDTKVLYYAEIGLMLEARSMHAVFGLQSAMLNSVVQRHGRAAVHDLPMMSTATPQANSYAIFVAAGGRPVCEVADNPLATLSEPFLAFLDKMSVGPDEYFRRFRGNMKEVLRARRRMAQGGAQILAA